MAAETTMDAAQIKRKRRGYLTLSTATLLLLGLIYAFSMFAAPLCSTFGLAKDEVGLTFNIMMIAFCVGGVIGSQIEKAFGVKCSIMCSGILFFTGFAGTGLLGTHGIMAVHLLYGVCGGIGVGIGYNSIIATTNVWFPDKVGFSSGVLMMGFGVSALLIGNLALGFVAMAGLPAVLVSLGLITLAISLSCAFVLKKPPANISEALSEDSPSTSSRRPATKVDPNAGRDDKPLMTLSFYVYWLWATIVIAIGLATIGSCASDAQLVGFDAGFATLLVGIVSTTNGLARIIMGMVYDKTNVEITMGIDALVAILAASSIVAAFATGIEVLYAIGALCCGFCYGAVPVVASAFSRQRFGSKNYPLNLSIANFAIVFGSLLNIGVQAAVGGATNRFGVFVVLFAMSVVAFIDVIPFSKLQNKEMKSIEEASSRRSQQAE